MASYLYGAVRVPTMATDKSVCDNTVSDLFDISAPAIGR
jgi:hypothetical protein